MLNGPNLGLLGTREPGVYGSKPLEQIVCDLKEKGRQLGVCIEAFQSDIEGELVSKIGESAGRIDGIIMNPAAFTHTSIALRDALQAVDVPCVEVHLSNTHAREEFRKENMTAAACVGQVMGFGATSYMLALDGLVNHISGGK